MNLLAKLIYQKFLPLSIRSKISKIKYPYELRTLRKKIFLYYSKIPFENLTSEQKDVLEYLKDNEVCNFPGNYKFNYNQESINVFTDDLIGLHYVIFDDKRLYFRRGSTTDMVKSEFYNLLVEQDKNSPHCYLSSDFFVDPSSVVVDIGTAEGLFSLTTVDTARKIYLFEPDLEWVEALEATFSPWKDKTVIINKYVSDNNDGKNISLDHYFDQKESIDFLKIDVDGAEAKVLKGSKNLIANQKHLKIALCSYHNQNDEKVFTKLLVNNGFETSFSKGYMIFINDGFDLYPPYFRRGLIRATK